jgi:hypothetical protein
MWKKMFFMTGCYTNAVIRYEPTAKKYATVFQDCPNNTSKGITWTEKELFVTSSTHNIFRTGDINFQLYNTLNDSELGNFHYNF